MTKTFCNLCGKEITPDMLAGGFMRSIEKFPVKTVNGLLGTHETNVQKQIVPDVWDLCNECIDYVWKSVEKRREELREIEEKKVLSN